MKNKEKFLDEIIDCACMDTPFAVSKDGSFIYCKDINCCECLFSDDNSAPCCDCRKQWLEQEFNPWKNVSIDTPIFVRDCESAPWEKRHFAGYDVETGLVDAYNNGCTSFSVDDENNKTSWFFAKIAESEKIIGGDK